MLLLVGCLTSQQHASASQGRICSDNFTCCHTEIEVADQTFHLTQSQYTDIGRTSPSTDPITPGPWQGSQWSANFEVTSVTRPRKRDSNPGSSAFEADAFPLGQRGGQIIYKSFAKTIFSTRHGGGVERMHHSTSGQSRQNEEGILHTVWGNNAQ